MNFRFLKANEQLIIYSQKQFLGNNYFLELVIEIGWVYTLQLKPVTSTKIACLGGANMI